MADTDNKVSTKTSYQYDGKSTTKIEVERGPYKASTEISRTNEGDVEVKGKVEAKLKVVTVGLSSSTITNSITGATSSTVEAEVSKKIEVKAGGAKWAAKAAVTAGYTESQQTSALDPGVVIEKAEGSAALKGEGTVSKGPFEPKLEGAVFRVGGGTHELTRPDGSSILSSKAGSIDIVGIPISENLLDMSPEKLASKQTAIDSTAETINLNLRHLSKSSPAYKIAAQEAEKRLGELEQSKVNLKTAEVFNLAETAEAAIRNKTGEWTKTSVDGGRTVMWEKTDGTKLISDREAERVILIRSNGSGEAFSYTNPKGSPSESFQFESGAATQVKLLTGGIVHVSDSTQQLVGLGTNGLAMSTTNTGTSQGATWVWGLNDDNKYERQMVDGVIRIEGASPLAASSNVHIPNNEPIGIGQGSEKSLENFRQREISYRNESEAVATNISNGLAPDGSVLDKVQRYPDGSSLIWTRDPETGNFIRRASSGSGINTTTVEETYSGQTGKSSGGVIYQPDGNGGLNKVPFGTAAEPAPSAAPPRPASSTFITPVDDTHVTLSQGGTVSDIVREQNRAGNPITADDVRAANPDLNINDKFTNVRAGDVLQIPKRVGDNLVTSIEGGGTRSVNTKTNEITTVVPNADGTTTQTTSSTDGEFGRTVRTLVYDTKTGDVIREQREAINLLDNTRTPLDANGQPLTQPAPPTPATHAHSGGGGADEADSFDDFDGGDGDEDETAATTEAAYAQLVEAFSAPQEQHQDPHAVLLADAGTYTTSNTIVSDAGGGGKATTEPATTESNYNDVSGLDLQSDQASAAIAAAQSRAEIGAYNQAFAASNQFNSMTRNWEHMSDAQRITGLMTLYNQIDNLATNTASTFLPDGTPSGHAKAGDNLPGSVSTPLAWVNMATTIDSMSQWDKMGDQARLTATLSLYTQANAVATQMKWGEIPGADYAGPALSYISLAQAIDKGDVAGMISSFNTVSGGAVDAALNAALGSAVGNSAVPYVGIIMALNNFEQHPGQSIGSLVGMCFGPMGSMIGGMIGGALDQAFGPKPDKPVPIGEVHFAWDGDGDIQINVDVNKNKGADAAKSLASNVLGMLEQMVDSLNAQTLQQYPDTPASELLAINPNLLPRIGYSYNHEKQASYTWMEITQPDGSTTQESLSQANLAQRLLEVLTDNGGLAPQWLVDTQEARFQHMVESGADGAAIYRELHAGQGGHAYAGNQAHALHGNAVESADFKSQSYGALIVSSGAGVLAGAMQNASDALGHTLEQLATIEALRDVENDGFMEATQWVAATNAAGQAQGLLVIDFNRNGLIETRDILNLGGNAAEAGNVSDEAIASRANADLQRNNIEWLDANADGVLDSHDPAFCAIKLWVDVNADGVMQGGESAGLAALQITALNFATGEVTYADGHSSSLTAATLHADTEGARLTQIQETVLDENEVAVLRTLNAGTVLEHEGYVGQVQTTDDGGTRFGAVRKSTFEHQALRVGDWEGTADQELHRHGGIRMEGGAAKNSYVLIDGVKHATATGARSLPADLAAICKSANNSTWRQAA